MSVINTTNPALLSIVNDLNSQAGLPFQKLLPTQVLDSVMEDVTYRDRMYSPLTTLYGMLSESLDAERSLQKSVARIIADKIEKQESVPSANTSAFSQARARLPLSMIQDIFKYVNQTISASIPEHLKWNGRDVKIIDGSTLSMPDTPANQSAFPQHKNQKEGIGFPLTRIVVMICAVTGALLRMAMGPYAGKETGEHALLRMILDGLVENDVVLGDSYYPSYFLLCELKRMGVDFVFSAHGSRDVDFRLGLRLGQKDHLVEWVKPLRPEWLDEETYNALPNTIEIREVAIIKRRPGFRDEIKVIVTSFLDVEEVSKGALSNLYDTRWFVELDLNAIKSVMKMDILRSKTPDMIKKEITVHLLAYNLIRRIMLDAAVKHCKHPRTLSFKTALTFLETFRQQGILNSIEVYEILLKCIAHKMVNNRPGRSEPRAIKRRPKSHPRLTKPRSFYKNKQLRRAA